MKRGPVRGGLLFLSRSLLTDLAFCDYTRELTAELLYCPGFSTVFPQAGTAPLPVYSRRFSSPVVSVAICARRTCAPGSAGTAGDIRHKYRRGSARDNPFRTWGPVRCVLYPIFLRRRHTRNVLRVFLWADSACPCFSVRSSVASGNRCFVSKLISMSQGDRVHDA